MKQPRQFTLIAASAIAALAAARWLAADEPAEEQQAPRSSAPVRVLAEAAPAQPAAGAPAAEMMRPMPAQTALVPPQYRTAARSRLPAETASEDASSPSVRFIVPLVQRPVFVEARVTIDGKPFRMLREARIDELSAELAKAAPAAGFSKTENAALPAANSQAPPAEPANHGGPAAGAAEADAPAPPPAGDSLPARLRRYAATAQRSLGRDELRWLLANWAEGPPLLLLHENFERLRADQAPLARTLDQDEDGLISSAEIARAGETLLKYDRNQDDVLSLDELQAAAARTPQKRPTRAAEPAPLIPLADLTNRQVFASLAARYAADGDHSAPAALARFDANNDGRVEEAELARLQTLDPDLQIDVAFDSADASRSRLDAAVLDRSLGSTPATIRGASVTLSLAGALLEFSAIQPAGAARADQISIGAVRDGYPLLPEIDFNEDGRLTLREMRQAAKRLPAFDRDGDGAVSADELPPTLRVAIGLGATIHRQLATVRSVHPASSTPGARPPAWFARMDRNQDGDLSRREFLGRQQQFETLDADGDQLIDIDEAAAGETPSPQDKKQS